jgi:virginiamycin B lyase
LLAFAATPGGASHSDGCRLERAGLEYRPAWAAAGTVTEFNLPAGTAFGITAGPDGNLWFNEQLAGEIGQITPN